MSNFAWFKAVILIFEKFSCEFDIMFNVSKCKLITFGHAANDIVSVYINRKLVDQVPCESHLGFKIGNE